MLLLALPSLIARSDLFLNSAPPVADLGARPNYPLTPLKRRLFLEPFSSALILRGMSKDETIDGSKIAALILSRMPAKDQERIMSSIQAKSPSIAAKLEDSLFNFDRIAQLNDHAVQDLLKEIPHRDIVISLKAAGERVKEKLLENMSESKQRLVEEDFSTLPPMRVSDVQAAQRRILKKLEELYPEGGIGASQRSVLPRLA